MQLKVNLLLFFSGSHSVIIFNSFEPVINQNGLGSPLVLHHFCIFFQVNLVFTKHHCSEGFFAIVFVVRLYGKWEINVTSD